MAATVEQERLIEVERTEQADGERTPIAEQKTFRPYEPDQVLLMAPVLRSGSPRETSPTSSPTWSRTRSTSPRSTPPMRKSAATRPMTRA